MVEVVFTDATPKFIQGQATAATADRTITGAGGEELKTVKAARRAIDAVDEKPTENRQTRIHLEEMDKLSLAALTAHSDALRRLIQQGMTLKAEAEALWEPHNRADVAARDLRVAGAPKEQLDVAVLGFDETQKVWDAKRREVEAVAEQVANAPFGALHDILLRADAAAWLIGTNGNEDNLPENAEDIPFILQSYRSAIEEMISRVPDREEWDEAAIALRKNARDLDAVIDELDADDHPEVEARHDKLLTDRDRLRTRLYSLDPPDVSGLLDMMVAVLDHSGTLDVSRYERRTFALGERPVTEEEQREDTDDSHRRALALVAHHAARLRDLEMPRDWQAAMRDIGGLHKNAKDAVRWAYEAGCDLANLKHIQLAGQPDEKLPVLLFDGADGQYWARPRGVWKGHIMDLPDGRTIQDGKDVL